MTDLRREVPPQTGLQVSDAQVWLVLDAPTSIVTPRMNSGTGERLSAKPQPASANTTPTITTP